MSPATVAPVLDDAVLGALRSAWLGLVAAARADGRLTATMARTAAAAGAPDLTAAPAFLPPLDGPTAEGTWWAWLAAAIDAGHAGRLTEGESAVLDDLAMGWRALPAAAWLGLPAGAPDRGMR